MQTKNLTPSADESQPSLFLRFGGGENEVLARLLSGKQIPLGPRRKIATGAGVWPPTSFELEVFAQEYQRGLELCHGVGTWEELHSKNWLSIISALDLESRLFPAWQLDPISYYSDEHQQDFAWLNSLFGKRVLVIHPMAESIGHQVTRLAKMHTSVRFLPSEVRVFQPPVTNGLTMGGSSYSKRLKQAKVELADVLIEFEPKVVLVAAGGYGVPLATFAYEQGYSSIQIGGCLQLLFGIMGNRWRESEPVLRQRTTNWLDKPLEKRHRGARVVEGATYW